MHTLMNEEQLEWEFNSLDVSLKFYLNILHKTSPLHEQWGGSEVRKIAKKTLNAIIIKRVDGKIRFRDRSIRDEMASLITPSKLRVAFDSAIRPADELVKNMTKLLSELKYLQTEKPLINSKTDEATKAMFLRNYENMIKEKASSCFGVLNQDRINKELFWMEAEGLFFDLIDDFPIERKLDILYGVAYA